MQTFKDFLELINFTLFHIGGTPVTLGEIAAGICIFLATLLVSFFVQRVLTNQLRKNQKIAPTLIYALNRIVHYVFIVLGVILSAQSVGLNFGTLLVAFGFLGVGIGFGLQNITSNFVSGLILLFERPIGVGDVVTVNGTTAEVININMRSTIVKTGDNVTIIVPNSKFIESEVTNWTIDDSRVCVHLPIGVAYGTDVHKVKEILLKLAEGHSNILRAPEPKVRFSAFGEISLNFDLSYWIGHPRVGKDVESDLNFAIEKAFREANISMPFPQRDVHLQMTPAVERLAKCLEK